MPLLTNKVSTSSTGIDAFLGTIIVVIILGAPLTHGRPLGYLRGSISAPDLAPVGVPQLFFSHYMIMTCSECDGVRKICSGSNPPNPAQLSNHADSIPKLVMSLGHIFSDSTQDLRNFRPIGPCFETVPYVACFKRKCAFKAIKCRAKLYLVDDSVEDTKPRSNKVECIACKTIEY